MSSTTTGPEPVACDPRPDAALLAAHLAGDRDAFAVLVRRHADRLWALALRTTGHREDAADALQEALLSAYRAAAAFRGEAAVTTWLHRIVLNACLDRQRRAAVRPVIAADQLPDRADPRAAAAFTAADLAIDLEAALSRLPVEQRAALVLVDVQGWSVAEAADLLAVAPGTVKSRCARGRLALARLLTSGNLTTNAYVPSPTAATSAADRGQEGGPC